MDPAKQALITCGLNPVHVASYADGHGLPAGWREQDVIVHTPEGEYTPDGLAKGNLYICPECAAKLQ